MIIRNDVRRGLFCTLLVFITTVSANDALMCTIAGPTSTSQVIYSEGLSPAWSVDAIHSTQKVTFDLVSTIAGRTGLFALRATFPSAWSYLILERRDYERTYGKKALVLRIRGVQNTSVNGQLWIRLRDFNYDWFDEAVPVARYMINADANGNFNSNTWYTVVIPIKDLGAENTIITGLILESGNASTYYLDDVWLVQGLEFPLPVARYSGVDTPVGAFDARISSVFDHHMSATEYSCPDNTVTAYTGEEGQASFGAKGVPDSVNRCGSVDLRGYGQEDEQNFLVDGNYWNGADNAYLFYDGHTGYDYPTDDGTPVYAVADGEVIESMDYDYGGTVIVKHRNGYESNYLHLSRRDVILGKTDVIAGVTKIGETGSGHLHFTMKLHGVRVDPYGWQPVDRPDPYRATGVNVPLWKQ